MNEQDTHVGLPAPGSQWIWEPDKPHARERCTVTEVKWNGEEWWVRTRPTIDTPGSRKVWGDLARFREACIPDPGEPSQGCCPIGGKDGMGHVRASFDDDA